MANANSKIYYYGVDAATKSIHFWGVDNDIYTGSMDDETGEWELFKWSGVLPPVIFATSYRILDSDGTKIIYQVNGQNYLGDYYLAKLGSNGLLFGVNSVDPTTISRLASSEDEVAKAAASPLVPILLVAAAYFIFIK